jgi:hypothetical protein
MNFVKTFPENVLPAKAWILAEVGIFMKYIV